MPTSIPDIRARRALHEAKASSANSYDDERGYGWVAFAGVLLLISGTLNVIEGLAAIGNSHFFVANTHYIGDSSSFGGDSRR